MEDYRKIMEREIEDACCICCGNSFLKIGIHHIDGNHKNNDKENLTCCCNSCHQFIHKGFNGRKNIPEETRERIFYLRKELLRLFYKYPIDKIEDRIKFERALVTNRGFVKKCYVCGTKRNLKILRPNFIERFDTDKSLKIGIVVCDKCLENSEEKPNLNVVTVYPLNTTNFKR